MKRIGIPMIMLVRIAHCRKELKKTAPKASDYPKEIIEAAKRYGITIKD